MHAFDLRSFFALSAQQDANNKGHVMFLGANERYLRMRRLSLLAAGELHLCGGLSDGDLCL